MSNPREEKWVDKGIIQNIDNDDPPATASGEEAKKGAGEITAFRSAALKFCESTGADVAAAFKQFDLDNSGDIDLMELMACAMTCGVGFTSTAEAEAKHEAAEREKREAAAAVEAAQLAAEAKAKEEEPRSKAVKHGNEPVQQLKDQCKNSLDFSARFLMNTRACQLMEVILHVMEPLRRSHGFSACALFKHPTGKDIF